MKKSKFLFGLSVCLIFAFFVSGTSTLAAGPLFESYRYQGVSGNGPDYAKKIIGAIGYDAKMYTDTTAYYVRRTMNEDALFYYSGHAAPGILTCGDGTQMSAKSVSTNASNYSLEAAFASTSNKLKQMRLAYYSGCYTANTSNTYGNLLTYTVATLKAGVAMGFSRAVESNLCDSFDRSFWEFARNYSIELSVDKALADTKSSFGASLYSESNIGSICFVGVSSLKLTPAAYYN